MLNVFIVGLTGFLCLVFGDNYVKTNDNTPILSATKTFARDSSFWQYNVYSDAWYGFRASRCQFSVGAILVDSRASGAN